MLALNENDRLSRFHLSMNEEHLDISQPGCSVSLSARLDFRDRILAIFDKYWYLVRRGRQFLVMGYF